MSKYNIGKEISKLYNEYSISNKWFEKEPIDRNYILKTFIGQHDDNVLYSYPDRKLVSDTVNVTWHW